MRARTNVPPVTDTMLGLSALVMHVLISMYVFVNREQLIFVFGGTDRNVKGGYFIYALAGLLLFAGMLLLLRRTKIDLIVVSNLLFVGAVISVTLINIALGRLHSTSADTLRLPLVQLACMVAYLVGRALTATWKARFLCFVEVFGIIFFTISLALLPTGHALSVVRYLSISFYFQIVYFSLYFHYTYKRRKLVGVLGMLLSLTSVLISGSRSGLIYILLVVVLSGLLSRSLKVKIATLTSIGIATVMFLNTGLTTILPAADLLRRFDTAMIFNNARFNYWSVALSEFSLLGNGLNSFKDLAFMDGSVLVATPHNTFVYIFYVGGIMGLVFGCLVLLSPLQAVGLSSASLPHLAAASIISLVNDLPLIAVTNSRLYEYVLVWLFIGIVAYRRRDEWRRT